MLMMLMPLMPVISCFDDDDVVVLVKFSKCFGVKLLNRSSGSRVGESKRTCNMSLSHFGEYN